MNIRKQETGFAVFELTILLVAIAVIAAVGWRVYDSHKTKSSTSAVSSQYQSPKASNVSQAPAISSSTDLDKSQQILDQNDPTTTNSSDSSQLDSQLSTF